MASNKLRTRIVYTSEAVDQMSDAEVRKAYTSIRHIAVERAKRLKKMGYSNTEAGKMAERIGFPKISETTPEGLRQILLDTSLWLRRRSSMAGEVRKKNRQTVKSFQEMGYTFINETNVVDFLNFMNEVRETYADKNYDYAKIADAYELADRYQIPSDELLRDFDTWMEGDTLQRIDRLGEGASSKDVRELVNKKKKVREGARERVKKGEPFNWKDVRRDVKRKGRK